VPWSWTCSSTGCGLVDLAIRQPDSATVLHSDHGTQFNSWAFAELTCQSGLVPPADQFGVAV